MACISVSVISHILASLINCSICSGIFPDSLKTVKFVQLHKSDFQENITNYRLISILPYFSKFFEKLIYNRTLSFFSKFSVIKDCQFSFRQHHSAYMPISFIHSKISHNLEQGKSLSTIGVFLDLAKAFDKVNHRILLETLQHYGIHGKCLSWFHSYLSGQTQMVSFKDTLSSTAPRAALGVSQGYILGPLIFLVYVNDMCNSSVILEFSLSVLSGVDVNELYSIMNNELLKVTNWCNANILSTRKKLLVDHSLYIGDSILAHVDTCKFLGTFVDQHLTFKSHIQYLTNKASKNIGISHICCYITSSIVITLYYLFINPYVSYCNLVWASNCSSYLLPLLKLQKDIYILFYIQLPH